ncbi:MAG: glycosyltransferase [Candidatus Buchananbacteria bacterium]|jgi:glycosyltransferase involved in cell wall biosynthesis
MPKISVIIPALNEEKSLPFTLESIKEQDFKDFEIIIADAGSTDDTIAIAEKYGCKVVKGGMPAVGRNAGAKVANGEWLLFLDADVYLSDKFMSFLIEEADETSADIASCAVIPLSDKIIDQIMHATANAYINLTQYFYPHAPGFCIFVKRSLHEKIGGFDESLKLAEDHEYVKRAKEFGAYHILKKPKIYVSVRRMESDGRFNVAAKYVACEVYRALLGEIRTDLFKYKFGHHYDKIKNKIKSGL